MRAADLENVDLDHDQRSCPKIKIRSKITYFLKDQDQIKDHASDLDQDHRSRTPKKGVQIWFLAS